MLEYAPFEPLQESINERKKIEKIRYEERQSKLSEIKKMYGLEELKSDYYNMTTYYYQRNKGYIWGFENSVNNIGVLFKPQKNEFEHIKRLNQIFNDNFYIQPSIINEL
jgi:hypothetical protein